MKPTDFEKRIEEALLKSLGDIPFVKVESARELKTPWGIPDVIAKVQSPEGERILVVEAKTSGQPRLAREAINQLSRYKSKWKNAYGIFMAPYISPRSAEICSQEGIGYMDLAGNCYLSFDKIFIKKERPDNPFAQKRELRTLYSPKATRVLRVLLSNPRKRWKLIALAEEAQVSLGQVSNVKKLLMDREWIQASDEGFSLNTPQALLTEWSDNYSYRRNRIYEYYSLNRIEDIEVKLADTCRSEGITYAFTGFSAAERLSPAVRYQKVAAYVQDKIERVASLLNLKKVSTGSNISLWDPYDAGVFYACREIKGVQVVSPIQAYLDLKAFKGRGEEAANALLDELIKPKC